MPKTDPISISQSKGKPKEVILPPRKRESMMNAAVAVSQLEGYYSPRSNPAIFVQQLESIPLSHVRNEPISCKDRRLHLISSFRDLRVSAPVPSKRFRHRIPSPAITASLSTPPHHHRRHHINKNQPMRAATNNDTRAIITTTTTTSSTSLPLSPSKQGQRDDDDEMRPASQRRGPEYAYPRESLGIPLLLDPAVQDQFREGDEKAREKEYWRRQRRVFLQSRFISKDEATAIANRVFWPPVASTDRAVATFQANIANFRSKWRKLLRDLAKQLTHAQPLIRTAAASSTVNDDISMSLEQEIQSKIDHHALDKVWGHWMSDPFVDVQAFYANTNAVDTLTSVTAKAILVTLKHNQGLLKERDFRKHLDDLDKYTRNLELPDPKK